MRLLPVAHPSGRAPRRACSTRRPVPSRLKRFLLTLLVPGSVLSACVDRSPGMRMPEEGPAGSEVAGPGGRLVGRVGSPGEWALPAKDYGNSRFSELDQITAGNVQNLRPVWSFSTGVLRGHQGQPLVVDGTMYVVTPFPNVLYAFDLTQPGYPLKWKYRPPVNPSSIGVACCDVVNRGPAYADGKIVYNLLDAHTVAVDARTGREVWKTKLGEIDRGETMTMAPLIVKDKVLVGVSGGEMGVRGWIAALDLGTGRELWRGYSTGPDEEVLIDQATYRAPYPSDRGRDLGVTTWPTDGWKQGGAAVWLWLSYDPELDLVYYGTGNPGPWNPEQRPGDNKWATSVLARDPDDGSVRWAYQITPHDEWDFDATNEKILVDLPIGGQLRKVLVHFDRNGFAYTQDRATGEVLLAKPFVAVNWATGVDLRTGLPDRVPEKSTNTQEWTNYFCPSHYGGKDQQPAAFSPRTGLFYVPSNNLCEDFLMHEVSYISGTPYMGVESRLHPGPGDHLGEFLAWDATTGRKVWSIKERFPLWGGALTTAGDLVFYGTLDGWLKAVDARTGKQLWQHRTGTGIVGNPITYLGPDGKQYVAILAGIGGVWYDDVAHSDDPYDLRKPTQIVEELGRHTSWGGMLWIFAL